MPVSDEMLAEALANAAAESKFKDEIGLATKIG
jgi:hypothetical protein